MIFQKKKHDELFTIQHHPAMTRETFMTTCRFFSKKSSDDLTTTWLVDLQGIQPSIIQGQVHGIHGHIPETRDTSQDIPPKKMAGWWGWWLKKCWKSSFWKIWLRHSGYFTIISISRMVSWGVHVVTQDMAISYNYLLGGWKSTLGKRLERVT